MIIKISLFVNVKRSNSVTSISQTLPCIGFNFYLKKVTVLHQLQKYKIDFNKCLRNFWAGGRTFKLNRKGGVEFEKKRTFCSLWKTQSVLKINHCCSTLSGITNRMQGEGHPPGKLNVKTGPPLADVLIFGILLVLIGCCFLHFSGCFRFFS